MVRIRFPPPASPCDDFGRHGWQRAQSCRSIGVGQRAGQGGTIFEPTALTGVTIPDLPRAVKEKLSGTISCTHLNDLLRSLAGLARLAPLALPGALP